MTRAKTEVIVRIMQDVMNRHDDIRKGQALMNAVTGIVEIPQMYDCFYDDGLFDTALLYVIEYILKLK